ncbi:MAG TPA: MCP four helix bundle domain-containing protein, partial [Steroidobacteraceae bacterium]|nr:MCP four helix bundle domain-containing protein [Steroidobacteraceae bacterium]
MIYRNSVGARLMLAFAGVIMVFGAAVAISIFRLAAFNAAIADITTLQFKKVETSNAWAASLSESMRHTRNILIMDDKAQIQGEITKVQALAEKRKELADTMTAIVQSAAGKVLLQAALDASTALKPLDEDYLRQVQSGDIKAAKDTLLERSRPAQLALIAALQKLVDHEIEHIHGRADEISAAYHSALMFLITLSLGAVAVACVLAWWITRAIKKPLNHAVEVLGEIEKGNYASAVTVGSQDEIGQTLKGLERMQNALRERTEKEHAAAMKNARI